METVKRAILNDRFCMETVGIELVAVRPGWAQARLAVGPQHLNGLGIVQGGAIFTLADLALAAAANSHGIAAVSVNAGITYAKAVAKGVLYAEAVEESRGTRLGTYTVRVTDEADELVAMMQATVYRKKERLAELLERKEQPHPSDEAPRG